MSRRPALALTLAIVVGATALYTVACGSDGGGDGALVFQNAPALLISIDTLRADRLGCYGYGRGTSPELDAFAKECVLFEEVYAPSCKTAESHMSLFTSLPVTAHGVSNASERLAIPPRELCENRLTLGQMLRRGGYWNTAEACGGNLMPQMGFVRGFEGRFDSRLRDVKEIVDATLQQIDAGLAQPRPLFAFMHTYQVHGPYIPPPEFRQRFAPEYHGVVGERVKALEHLPFDEQFRAMNTNFWVGVEQFGPEDAKYLSDLYDGEIAYTDQEVGRLLGGLRDRGVLDKMVVVILSDHGEEFAEHGDYQHDQLYGECLHVPLLVHLPGGRLGGTKVTGLASLIDVAPTLLELLGVDPGTTLSGHSLVPAMQSGRTSNQPVLSERTMFADAYQAALRTPACTAQFRAKEGTLEHYDLAADPHEHHPLDPPTPPAAQTAAELKSRLAALFAARETLDKECDAKSITLDEQARKELLDLGYVGGGEVEAPAGSPLERWPADASR
jgi:arylsulfatase A-like enzyme